MSKSVNIAILGATGAVGQAILTILEEHEFPVGELYPLASHRSAGDTVYFKQKPKTVIDVETFDFSKADIGLFSAGSSVSEKYAPIANQAGCIVIDNTSHFRYQQDVPLVIPEVNPDALEKAPQKKLIANPNCSTIQMLVAIKPIYDAVGIERINVATYQAVSGSGKKAVSELITQTTEMLNGRSVESEIYPHAIAFNVIPHIDRFEENGYTREEMKMVWETQKILDDPDVMVNPTAVRVPVVYGHSEAIHIETSDKITAQAARDLLKKAPGVEVWDDEPSDYPTALTTGAGHEAVYVGRIREDISCAKGLNLWVVSDNVRKGAALNTIQIAELLINN